MSSDDDDIAPPSLIEQLLPDSDRDADEDDDLDPYDSVARLRRAREVETVEAMKKRMGLP